MGHSEVWQTLSIGNDYLPRTIRARSGDKEFLVEEVNPDSGSIRVDLPSDFNDELAIDFQRSILRGSEPRPDRVIGTADACIYCGAISGLQDEHVIPFALEGELVLRKASCGTCAARTSQIERAVLRDLLLPARAALDIRTRRKANRPTTLPIKIGENQRVIHVSIAEHPTFIALPLFDSPALLRGADQPHLQVRGAWTKLVGISSLGQASSRLGEKAISLSVGVDAYEFARMLGKIAYGFAVAADLDSVSTNLPAAILGRGESIGWWVGGSSEITLEGEGLHTGQVSVIEDVVYVRLRLFAQLGGPEYLVIAGRLITPSPNEQLSVTVEVHP